MFRARKRTARKLDKAFQESLHLPFNPRTDRVVIFSDLHMADKTAVDDFVRNEMIYCHALQQYEQDGFRLVLNGDVEESWEAKAKTVREKYRDTAYNLERKFADKGPPWHVRIIGNHDMIWQRQRKVEKHLWQVLGPVRVYPGLRLGDSIFIAHGHQGDPFSDTLYLISRFAVRHGWRWLQKLMKMSTARAANNHFLRKGRDEALYSWSHSRGQLLIAGHTHRSMFGDVPETNQLVALLRSLEQELPTHPEPFKVRATIEHLRKLIENSPMSGISGNPLPSYFNGGSCVHRDGITGIELDRGQIRLIKWGVPSARPEGTGVGNGNGGEAERPDLTANGVSEDFLLSIERSVFREADLLDVLHRIRQGSQDHRVDPLTGKRAEEPETEQDESVDAAA